MMLKNLLRAGALAFVSLLGVSLACAQAPIQQSPTRLDSCTSLATATGAGNTTVTATLSPPAGQYVYICSLEFQVGGNAAVTGAAVVQACVTSGLSTNITFEADNSTLTAGQVKEFFYGLPIPWKSATAGTAFSLACSGLQSTQTLRVNLTGYFAP